jgi:hypothetical protein
MIMIPYSPKREGALRNIHHYLYRNSAYTSEDRMTEPSLLAVGFGDLCMWLPHEYYYNVRSIWGMCINSSAEANSTRSAY